MAESVLLSAALIVRDEEQVLEACLDCLNKIVNEIVVVDTGSTDGTRRIARELGARVFDFPWVQDYSAARNEALRHCRGKWILSVDADERYQPCRPEELESQLRDESKIAYATLFRIRSDFTQYRRIRLFRNDPLIRFQGLIQENVLRGVERFRSLHGGEIGESCLSADHVGYDWNQRKKNLATLPLLLECTQREPGKVIAWCHLANVYASLGESEKADKAWRQAVAVTGARREQGGLYDSVAYLGLIEWQIARGEDVAGLLEEAMRLFPGNLHLLWFRGRWCMLEGRYREAIPMLERLLTCFASDDFNDSYGNPADDDDHWFGYDVRLAHVLPYDSLATCYLRLGRYTESSRYFELAAKHDSNTLEYRLKKALSLHLEHNAR
jgi:glycosyltransferase involved in cell wall biosynthesis